MAASRLSSILKWVGYATAILSLIAGIREITKAASDRLEAHRRVDTLLASERIQAQGQDYESAWQSLEQASKTDPDSAGVHDAQETLAMTWLENIRVGEKQKFSDITEKLDPVLTRGIAEAKTEPRRADLLAHLGWSYFLRGRDTTSGPNPAATYAEAVRKDPDNPYAQAMWGHWILWNYGSTEEAERHFSAALASNRERDFVRHMQLGAFLDVDNSAGQEETVRVVNAIRKEHGSVSPELARQVFSMYYGKLIPGDSETPRFINAVSPAEHVATFRWLFDRLDLDESASMQRLGDLCVLQEAAGQRDEARAGYASLLRQLAGQPGSLLTAAEAGNKRLSRN